MNEAAPAPPFAVLAELTHRCPLQCPYCSNPLQLTSKAEELSTDVWTRVIDEAAELGALQIHFSGGEPTIRRDLEILVSHARSADLYVNLITSGIGCDEARIQALAHAGVDHAQLSIQDIEAHSADRIAQSSGSLKRKIAVAGWVRAAGLPLTLNAVVHRQNLHRLQAMIDLALALDAHRIEVAHVQYYGWALANRAALMPTRAQLDEATDTVERARQTLGSRLTIDYVVPDYYAQRPKPCMGGWGRRFINITPNGRALPCHAAETIDGLQFDSVIERSLAEIWQHSSSFRRFRGTSWMPELCRSCDQREIDWGGCRCQALALTGRADDTDPACALSLGHEAIRALAETESAAPAPDFIYRNPKRVPPCSVT
jgi:pyrroloquinoline quinone biosynthesis protein E